MTVSLVGLMAMGRCSSLFPDRVTQATCNDKDQTSRGLPSEQRNQ